ncbi:MAG: hypothetical protein ACRDS9_18560 [Pseudonocardiaceae bacterium]
MKSADEGPVAGSADEPMVTSTDEDRPEAELTEEPVITPVDEGPATRSTGKPMLTSLEEGLIDRLADELTGTPADKGPVTGPVDEAV